MMMVNAFAVTSVFRDALMLRQYLRTILNVFL